MAGDGANMIPFLKQLRNAITRNPRIMVPLIAGGLGAVGLNLPPELVDAIMVLLVGFGG